MRVAEGVDQLPSGNYRWRVEHGGEVVSGTCATVEEAIATRAATIQQIVDGELVPASGLSLKDIGPKFLASRRGHRDVGTDESRWYEHIATAPFARRPMSTVTRAELLRWVEALARKRTHYDPEKHGARPSKFISWETRRKIVNLTRRAFAWAVDHELIDANPLLDVSVARADGDEDDGYQDTWYLDVAEQKRLLEAFGASPERHVVAFAMGTGLRQGEQWCLHLEDLVVDGAEPHVIVRFGSWDPIKERYRPPKGRRGEKKSRRVPLFGVALDAARAWLKLLPSYAPKNPLGLVFPQPGGHRRDKKPPRDWAEAIEAFGLVHRIQRAPWWHLLRHTAASSMVSGWWGMRWALEDVQAVLGHTDIRTTQRYAHLAPSAVSATAARADLAFRAPSRRRHAGKAPIANRAKNKGRVRQDSNLRPTAPEGLGVEVTAEVLRTCDGAVTAIADVLREIAAGHLVAHSAHVRALEAALDAIDEVRAAVARDVEEAAS